jgi:hypothetical protein
MASAAAVATTASSSSAVHSVSMRDGQVRVSWASVQGHDEQVRVAVRVTDVHSWLGFGVKCAGKFPWGMQSRCESTKKTESERENDRFFLCCTKRLCHCDV